MPAMIDAFKLYLALDSGSWGGKLVTCGEDVLGFAFIMSFGIGTYTHSAGYVLSLPNITSLVQLHLSCSHIPSSGYC